MSDTFRFFSAGAGSGKTYRLTDLLHEMLEAGLVRPSGILATTFTNRAAAELRERVRSHLIKKERYALATAIGQARIGTVNSVCGNLLERFAFEAGMSTEPRVLDEPRAAQILSEAIDEVIEGPTLTALLSVARRLSLDRASFGDGDDPWKEALRAIVSQARSNAIGPDRLRGFGDWNADQLLSYLPSAATKDLDGSLLQAITAALPMIRQVAAQKGKKITAAYLNKLETIERALRDGDTQWTQWSALTNDEPEAALRTAVQPINDAAREHVSHPRLHQDVRDYLRVMFSLAADVLERYRTRKRELGVVDFTDQECELLQILDLPAVAQTLSAELDLLMVDEFQDTSPIQLALFLKLAQFARHVVWVGDVKQAIYGFRGGDATLMTAVINRLPELNGEKEVLLYSWRSRPSLVGFVNGLFGHAFDGIEAPDVELIPKRNEFEGTVPIEDWLLDGKNEEQHQGIASGIVQLVQSGTLVIDRDSNAPRPIRFRDIAVLARSNKSVKSIASALETRQIRVSTEQPGLLNRPEIVLALACLRRLNDERDTIATAEIASLAECEDPEAWLADRLAWLNRGESAEAWREQGTSVHPLFQAIQALRQQRALLSPREAVQLVIVRCDLGRRVLQWGLSPERAQLRLANLNRLVEVAVEYEDECRSTREAATLSGFLLWLQELASNEMDVLPLPPIDAVQVMTHHGAKGLEWPVVVLADLASDVKDCIWDAVRAESPSAFDVRSPLNDRVLRYWPWPCGAQSKVPIADMVEGSTACQVLRAAAVEEHKRLLYVSVTRARDVLIFARPARKPDGGWMSTVGLADRLASADEHSIVLPNGSGIPFRRRMLTPTTVVVEPAVENGLHWFQAALEHTPKLPLTVSPSLSVPVNVTVAESVVIGSRISVAIGVEPAALGEAIHACVAAHVICANRPRTADDVSAILGRMGVCGSVAPEALLGQLNAVRGWLDQRWPSAKPLVEVPITLVLDNGQRVNGRIDLLLQTSAGWVLLDYKSGSQGSAQWEQLAKSYGGQLAAYSEAIASVTGTPVVETWLVLPVAGSAIRVERGT